MICHGGWAPISAGIVKGKLVTSTIAIKDDLVNAGVNWVNEEVVVDENQISSRSPADLPAFYRTIIIALSKYNKLNSIIDEPETILGFVYD